MKKYLVLAYTGSGKTCMAQRYKNVIDLDWSPFKWIYDETEEFLKLTPEQRKGINNRRKNPEYPSNYVKRALELINDNIILIPLYFDTLVYFDEVVQGISADTREAGLDTQIILVYPSQESIDDLKERFRGRGNSEEFFTNVFWGFYPILAAMEKIEHYDKIVLKPGEFLDQALIKYGINLEPKN